MLVTKKEITNDEMYELTVDIMCLTGKIPDNIEEACNYAHKMIMSENGEKGKK
jgi:hypothetical protein